MFDHILLSIFKIVWPILPTIEIETKLDSTSKPYPHDLVVSFKIQMIKSSIYVVCMPSVPCRLIPQLLASSVAVLSTSSFKNRESVQSCVAKCLMLKFSGCVIWYLFKNHKYVFLMKSLQTPACYLGMICCDITGFSHNLLLLCLTRNIIFRHATASTNLFLHILVLFGMVEAILSVFHLLNDLVVNFHTDVFILKQTEKVLCGLLILKTNSATSIVLMIKLVKY